MGMYDELTEKVMAPTPVLLPGKSHGQRSLAGCGPWGCKESDTTEWLPFHFSLYCIGEGNGNPLQCSCLENPRDEGAAMGSHRVGHDWSDLAAAAVWWVKIGSLQKCTTPQNNLHRFALWNCQVQCQTAALAWRTAKFNTVLHLDLKQGLLICLSRHTKQRRI